MTDEVQILGWDDVADPPSALHEWVLAQSDRPLAVRSALDVVGAATVGADGQVRWLFPTDVDERLAVRGIDALIDYAFTTLGLHRVQARLDADARHDIRLASRAGMRKEGTVRGGGAGNGDLVQFARIASDPDLADRTTFTAVLNAGLPTKRCIAQAIVRDAEGRILVCELVYKRFWDLPGGVVDPFESPAQAVQRELKEELDVDAAITRLAAISWLPPWRGWDDATLFVFEATLSEPPKSLQPREIRAVHWLTPEELPEHVAPYTVRVIEQALASAVPVYLEDGRPTF